MAKAKKIEDLDLSTEGKIKAAALKLFTKKGFAATRTRDISEESGINLALLNYYFRSKEKLFDLVMMEVLRKFFLGITQIFNDKTSTLDEKVTQFVSEYTAMLMEQPELPLFIFHELRMEPEKFASRMGVSVLFKSFFFKQLAEEIKHRKIKGVQPLHYVINMIGLCVFPFIAAPVFRHAAGLDANSYDKLIEERKTLVPQWMKMMMKTQ